MASISEIWTDYDNFYQKSADYKNSEVGKAEEKQIKNRAEETLKEIKNIVDKIDKNTLANFSNTIS